MSTCTDTMFSSVCGQLRLSIKCILGGFLLGGWDCLLFGGWDCLLGGFLLGGWDCLLGGFLLAGWECLLGGGGIASLRVFSLEVGRKSLNPDFHLFPGDSIHPSESHPALEYDSTAIF